MLLISLIGEQPIPNLLPIRALQPDENLLVYTDKTEPVARRLRAIISGGPDLGCDLQVPAYHFDRTLAALRAAMPGTGEVVFNLTGGTKMMALAAYALAVQTGRPFVYIENQRSRLARYGFEDGGPVLQSSQELPALIDAGDYLNAHLPGFAVEGYSRDEKGRLSEGGQFEAAVHQALASRLDEVLAGVRPAGVASQIEIDLVLRCGNAVGIAEVKLGGGDSGKRGLDQLKMEGESTYLGAYTSQFLITAAFKLRDPIRTLAYKRGVHIIQIPNYKPGQPLSRPDADRLAREIRQVLNP